MKPKSAGIYDHVGTSWGGGSTFCYAQVLILALHLRTNSDNPQRTICSALDKAMAAAQKLNTLYAITIFLAPSYEE